METKEIRLNNLILLLDKYSSKQAFADHIDMAPAHVSQIVSGYRSMGNIIARRIEKKEGLPLGYMDAFHGQQKLEIPGVSENVIPYTGQPEDIAEEKALFFADEFERKLEIRLSSHDKRELFKRMRGRYLRQLSAGQKIPENKQEMEAEVLDFIEITKQMQQ